MPGHGGIEACRRKNQTSVSTAFCALMLAAFRSTRRPSTFDPASIVHPPRHAVLRADGPAVAVADVTPRAASHRNADAGRGGDVPHGGLRVRARLLPGRLQGHAAPLQEVPHRTGARDCGQRSPQDKNQAAPAPADKAAGNGRQQDQQARGRNGPSARPSTSRARDGRLHPQRPGLGPSINARAYQTLLDRAQPTSY